VCVVHADQGAGHALGDTSFEVIAQRGCDPTVFSAARRTRNTPPETKGAVVEPPEHEQDDRLPTVIVELNPTDVERLERTTDLLDCSAVSAVRHGLELLDIVSRHIDAGGIVRMIHPDGENVTSVLLRLPGKGLQGVDEAILPRLSRWPRWSRFRNG
jgi:hypothetical protein